MAKLICSVLSFLVLTFYGGVLAEVPQEVELPEIVVTATRTPKEVSVAPAKVEVVTREDLDLKKPMTFDQALNDLPGVMVRRGKGLMDTLANITLRGVPEAKRTLILLDGIPLNDPYAGSQHLGGFYPESLERIEVAKGPFSSLYGGYAMGGVVHLMTRMPEKLEVKFKGGYGDAFEEGEAMENLRRFSFSVGDRVKDVSFFLSYGRQETEGYPTDLVTDKTLPRGTNGAVPSYDRFGDRIWVLGHKGYNRWWDQGFTGKVQWEISKETRLRFTVIRAEYEYEYKHPETFLRDARTGDPVYLPREASYVSGPGGREATISALSFESDAFGPLKVKANISYQDIDHWYVTAQTGAKIQGCSGVSPEKCGYVSAGPRGVFYSELQLSYPLFDRHFMTFGGSYRWEGADVKEEYLRDWRDEESGVKLKYHMKGKAQTWALFLQDEFTLRPNLTLYLGVRGDFWRTYDGYVNQVGTAGYPKEYGSKSSSSFSPKASLVWSPLEGTTLRASVGRAFRPPTIYDLYRTWTSSRGVTYAGNPDLDPEKVTSYELGIGQRLWKGAKVDFTLFYNRFEDLIYRKSVTENLQEYVNVGEAESKGFEVGFEQKFDFGLRLFVNATYTDSEVLDNKAQPLSEGKRLTYTPLWMANLGGELRKGRFRAYLVGRYMDKWYSDDLNKDKKEGVYGSYDEHFVVDARLSYDLAKFFELSLSVNNLFDEDYFYYYKAPGRSWFVEATLRF